MAANGSVIDANVVLTAAKSKLRKTTVELNGSVEAVYDLALLTVYDANTLIAEEYNLDTEEALQTNARRGVQLLVNQIFSQPTKASTAGVFATLPVVPSTILPREKPLPKPRTETKWDKFAKTKGIAPKQKRDRLVYDEEKQDFVPRWGYKGKNKDSEEQWIHEVPASADPNYDPVLAARNERKQRKLKNEGQRLKNEQRATESALKESGKKSTTAKSLPVGLAALESTSGKQPGSSTGKKADIERLLKSTRTATASLGKFDKVLDKEVQVIGKQGARGSKRKFEDNMVPGDTERQKGLSILKTLDKPLDPASRAAKKQKSEVVNARKAIRFESKGKGAAAMFNGGTTAGRGDKSSRGGKRKL